MKTRFFQRTFLLALIGTSLGISVPVSALAEYRCDHPQGLAERRACEYARQGPDALRHFIDRTRSFYGLYFYDFIRPE